jgi:type II restriction/modification system DNA methylase subunit YeeA
MRRYYSPHKATDRRIDALVYELYGLTEEEIKLIDGT